MDGDGRNDARTAVWRAMADLFLDTDVRLFFADVARVVASSPFDLGQLEHIYAQEVAPIVEPNLDAVAGEWAAFDDEWLLASIQSRLAAGKRPHRVPSGLLDRWHRVAHLVQRLRSLPDAERAARARQWHDLRGAFLVGVTPAVDTVELDPGTRERLLAEMRPAYADAGP